MGAGFMDAITLGLTLKLILSLGDFGLDPSEWQMAEGALSEHVLLINTKDPEFRLLGEVAHGSWKSIQVLSL